MQEDRAANERATGGLFGNLFAAYDDLAFKQSVGLFESRFLESGFDPGWFAGKRCLDAGCGGGRYTIALSRLGAKEVVGIDLSEAGIEDARKRANELGAEAVTFQVGSVGKLPFGDETFDCVVHSGVLQHTAEPVKVVGELARVLRPKGMVYMLVYATEGLRWPLVQMLRPLAQRLGFDTLNQGVKDAGMPANRRRTYLDDLLVPYIDFYSWPCLKGLLERVGFEQIVRWDKGRMDHEENLEAYVQDLRGFGELFMSLEKIAKKSRSPDLALVTQAAAFCRQAEMYAETCARRVREKELSDEDGRMLAIGQGHHRLIAWKP